MSALIWALLYTVSVIGVAYFLFVIAYKEVLTIHDVFAGFVISLTWPLVVVAAILVMGVIMMMCPIVLLYDHCTKPTQRKEGK